MAATTHNQAQLPQLRTRMTDETLEGRAMPATLIAHPSIEVAAQSALVNPVSAPSAMPIVSRIFVNGELVMRVKGKPAFAGIGPAASGNQNGQTESGGTTISVNGQVVGTFQDPPQIARTVTMVRNAHGGLVKVFSFHITGTPYVPPSAAARLVLHANAISGVWLG